MILVEKSPRRPVAREGEYVLGFQLFVTCGIPHLQINAPVNQNRICHSAWRKQFSVQFSITSEKRRQKKYNCLFINKCLFTKTFESLRPLAKIFLNKMYSLQMILLAFSKNFI